MEVSVLSSSANGASAGLAMAGMALPDILLDGDRLNMLLDIICTDYITASYASRENGKKVVLKALQKLYLSVYASAPHLSINIRDTVFADRCRVFYEELLVDFDRRRHQQLTETSSLQAARPMLSPSLPIVGDAIVKEVLKPKLVQFVEEIIKERDRLVRSTDGNRAQPASAVSATSSASSSSASIASSRTTVFPSGISNSNASSSAFVTGTFPGSGPLNASGLHSTTWQSGEIRMEGWLRKKGQHVNLWRDRYFMIRSTPNGTHYLCYFRKKGDKEPRGWYILGPGTTVDEVRESPSKIETKPLFTFRIRHLTHAASDDVDDEKATGSTGTAPASSSSTSASASASLLAVDSSPLVSSSHTLAQTTRAMGASFEMPSSPEASASGVAGTEYDPYDPRTAKKPNSRRFRSRAAAAAVAATAATAVVLTGGLAGVGIGMGMGMSAAAAASAGAAGTMIVQNRNKGPIALAAESLETAIWWRNSILECIAQAEEQWKRYLNWYMDKDHELQSSLSSEWTDGANASAGDGDGGVVPSHCVPLSGTLVKPTLTASVSGGSVTTASVSRSGSQKSTSATATRPRAGSFGTLPRSIAKTFRTSATFSQETSWKLYDFSSKLRVDVEKSQLNSSLWASLATTTSKHAPPPPALRTSVKVLMSPQKVFDLLMDTSSSFYRLNHVLQQAQVLEENKGDHSDVVYWQLAPTFLWPVFVESRDLCLLRYWRKEQDASYFICFQSTTHPKCPSPQSASAVRGSVLGGGFIISPRVHTHDDQFDECWVTLTIQMNPKGWIDSSLARSWYYMHAYGVYFLEMITALSALRPDVDTTPRPFAAGAAGTTSRTGGDPPSHSTESHATFSASSQLIVSEVQHAMLEPYRSELALKHALPPKFWSEPDATSFLVRGSQYFVSRTKVRSAPQAFRLVSVELLKSGAPSAAAAAAAGGATASAAHGKLKIQRIGVSSFEKPGLADCPLLLVINFMLPGPPNHSLVLYFTPGNPAELKKNSVFADLCHDFCRGASDEFRTKRLKLIPRIVQGTWSIREGVGSTPAILGTKVSHSYHQGTQFLEIDYDISSSTVASGIVKMLMGYARDLVIDLAFVIEAQSSLELPERVLGCVRLNGIDLRHAVSYTPTKSG